MDSLPQELWFLSLTYCTPHSLINFASCSKTSHHLARRDDLWIHHCATSETTAKEKQHQAEVYFNKQLTFFDVWCIFQRSQSNLKAGNIPSLPHFWNPARGEALPDCFWPLPDAWPEWNVYLGKDKGLLLPNRFMYGDRSLCIFEMDPPKCLQSLPMNGTNEISALCVTDRFIAVGTQDEPDPTPDLAVFFPETPEDSIDYKNYRKVPLKGHTNSIFDIKWIGVNEDLVSCGSIDKSICLWNVNEGKMKRRIHAQNRSCFYELYTPYENEPFTIYSCDKRYFDEWDSRASDPVHSIQGEDPKALFFPKDDNLFVLCLNSKDVEIHDRRNFNVPVATLDSGCIEEESIVGVEEFNGHVLLATESELRIYDLEYSLLSSLILKKKRTKIVIEHGMCFLNDEGVSYFDISSVIKGNEWSIVNLGGNTCSDSCNLEDIVTSPFGLVSVSSCGLFKCWKFL